MHANLVIAIFCLFKGYWEQMLYMKAHGSNVTIMVAE